MPDSPAQRPLVLVVEPNPENAVRLRRQLEHAGYAVASATRAAEALASMDEKHPVAVVCEVMLKGITGYDFVRTARAQDEYRLMPLVLMSKRAGKLDRDFAFTVGADDYFRKPFAASDLIARVAELIAQPEEEREILRVGVTAPVRIARRTPAWQPAVRELREAAAVVAAG